MVRSFAVKWVLSGVVEDPLELHHGVPDDRFLEMDPVAFELRRERRMSSSSRQPCST
jgi:hypothetical protein